MEVSTSATIEMGKKAVEELGKDLGEYLGDKTVIINPDLALSFAVIPIAMYTCFNSMCRRYSELLKENSVKYSRPDYPLTLFAEELVNFIKNAPPVEEATDENRN